MKDHTVKIISALLLAVLSATAVSCTDNGEHNTVDGTAKTAESDENVTVFDVYETIKHDVNYDGYSFNVLVTGQGGRTPNDFKYTDASTVMDEAIYQRNITMEDNYGVIIESKSDFGVSNSGNAVVSAAHNAEDSEYDMYVLAAYDASSVALNGYLYDIATLPYVDFSNTWWDQRAVSDLAIADSVYFTNGAISTVVDDFTHCVIFNKTLYKKAITDGTDVYELAKEGKWTMDALARLSKTTKADLNGDDTMDSNDLYGLMIWDNDLLAQLNAGGCKIAVVNDFGNAETNLYSERANKILSDFVEIGNSEYAINFQHMTGGVAWMDMFSDDQVLFFMTMFNEVSRFRDMKTDYGFLPMPKYDEEQEWYSPISDWHASFICISDVCAELERTGTIVELLGYHSEKLLTPAYYDKTLIGTYLRDDESVATLDIIFASRTYDIGHLYKMPVIEPLTNLLRNNNPSGFSTVYNTYRSSLESAVKQLNSTIEKLKNS